MAKDQLCAIASTGDMQGTPSTYSGEIDRFNVNRCKALLHTITLIVLQIALFLLDAILRLNKIKNATTPLIAGGVKHDREIIRHEW